MLARLLHVCITNGIIDVSRPECRDIVLTNLTVRGLANLAGVSSDGSELSVLFMRAREVLVSQPEKAKEIRLGHINVVNDTTLLTELISQIEEGRLVPAAVR